MKLYLIILNFVFMAAAQATPLKPPAQLVFQTESGKEFALQMREGQLAEEDVSNLWDEGGVPALIRGTVCYRGSASEVAKLLELLDKYEFVGDEYSIESVALDARGLIHYTIYDWPNDTALLTRSVGVCEN